MKLRGIAVATLAITALVGGTAVAQVTMQPIPNPPEKAHMAGHHHWVHHHHHWVKHHHHHHMMKAAPAPAATPPAQ